MKARRAPCAAVVLVIASAAGACSSTSSVRDKSTDAGSGGSATGGNAGAGNSTGGGGTCTDECRALPEGWTPAALEAADAACADGDAELDLFDDANFTAARCECACGDPAIVGSCNPGFGQVLRGSTCNHSDAACYTTETFLPDMCQPYELCVSQSSADDYTLLDGVPNLDPVPGECEPRLVSREVAPPTWGERARLCLPDASAAGCSDGELCVARPVQCVMRRGDHECPAGYPTRTLLFETIEDTRACTACECESVSVQCTNPRLETFYDLDCSINVETVQLSACASLTTHGPTDQLSMIYRIDTVLPLSCPSGGGEPVGLVRAVDAVSVCCE